MWSDNESELDLLGVDHLATAVKQTILDSRLLPITVGVFGDWGCGKSSLISMVRKDLESRDEKEGILSISFNGWLFEGYEDAKAALMGTILDELKDKRGAADKAKDTFERLLKRVNWMRLMGMAGRHAVTFLVNGPVAGGLGVMQTLAAAGKKAAGEMDVENMEKLVKDAPGGEEDVRRNIKQFRAEFEELLRSTGVKTLVVFIDDLDRCLPDTVIETLEAIRLFLYVPGTAFVISADERMVKAAVRKRFPHDEPEFDVARDYLEKLVQVPITIPPLGASDVKRYLNLLFAQRYFGAAFADKCRALPPPGTTELGDRELLSTLVDPLPSELEESLALTQQVGDVLAAGLNGNPRQIKRFLNTLVLRLSMAETRGLSLQRRMLAKLMLLEYIRTESFRKLAEWQATEAGRPVALGRLEAAARKQGEDADAAEPRTDKSGSPASDDLGPNEQIWLQDQWLRNWLSSEPKLASEDLGPYFFVSRDRIGAIIVPGLRLSPDAQRFLRELLSESDATRRAAVGRAGNLSPMEASGVFQALAQRVRQAEDLETPLTTLLEFAGARHELAGEAVQMLRSISLPRIKPGIPPRVLELSRTVPAVAGGITGLLQSWQSQETNKALAKAAANMLKRPTR